MLVCRLFECLMTIDEVTWGGYGCKVSSLTGVLDGAATSMFDYPYDSKISV